MRQTAEEFLHDEGREKDLLLFLPHSCDVMRARCRYEVTEVTDFARTADDFMKPSTGREERHEGAVWFVFLLGFFFFFFW